MAKIDFTVKIAGRAGEGIAVAGLILGKTALRSGFFVFDTSEYPSLIRGGHNVSISRVSNEKTFSLLSGVDCLIALNGESLEQHYSELSSDGIAILNSDEVPGAQERVLNLPLSSLAKKEDLPAVTANNIALGALVFLLKGDPETLKGVVADVFSGSGSEAVEMNIRAIQLGYGFAQKNWPDLKPPFSLSKQKPLPQLFLTGNDALALGAVKAGCRFFSAYPMTPINSLLAFFAAKAKDLGIVFYQPEDEIAGINSALGAAHAGLRAMTATSGGGFSLMVETLGMAGMTETPLVIVEGQRPGPSSGLPTWTSQGDLKFVLSAGQDDFPRVVLAPGDAEECFWQTIDAFNLAEKYQLPVIVLVDKYLCESHASVAPFDESRAEIDRGLLVEGFLPDYQRYQLTSSGISPRAFPGQFGMNFSTSSYEHDALGLAREEAENRKSMMEKRAQKMKILQKETPSPQIFGSVRAKLGLVAWGSTKGQVLEAQKILKTKNIETKFLHVNFLQPFPTEQVKEFCQSCQKVVFVEQNSTGQLADLVQEKAGFEIKNRLLKFDGRPFFPEEIAEEVKKTA